MRSDTRDASDWLDELLDTQLDGQPIRAHTGITNSVRGAALALGHDETKRKAGDLVRMALCAEFRREPLRRDDLARVVIGKEGTRAFPIILAQAQLMLRDTFGMELVELRARGAENPALAEQAAALDEQLGRKRAKTEDKKDTRRVYALKSTLPDALIASLALSDTPALDWSASDGHAGSMGLLYVILAIILLSGRRCSSVRLRAYLAQLSLSADRVLPSSLQPVGVDDTQPLTQARGRTDPLDLDAYLGVLQRQSYIESIRLPSSGEAQQKSEWRWGARAEVEIGEHAIASFIAQLFAPPKSEDGSSAAADDIKQRIERAAGTPLV
ncbi:hypothetical protein MCUN1_000275 [Malassezia cuniculi]|uniref:MAGE domain-containing protein n=1 Tax=Malassezia cuniculi TaxID=948313 RepID=A0AAF0J4H8_9BASI|nr:hypothetical protein MCUN1_000275 [Malassezia cuniculi]